eukprot:CAMPEP_0170741912 /NCGR_PEP_ID=MMETSP0437-20130122/6470_1 /TAXON_ID=0 /ORGANISM="Sexangularia sp." /LENGTH=309 /DNA_ID=CAMNT_0011080511 /DNA_START=61 /DNA_END=990 /DNA_ORIENTATION=+
MQSYASLLLSLFFLASPLPALCGGKYQVGVLLDQPEIKVCNGCECEGRVMWQLLRAQHTVKPLSSIHQLCNNMHKVVLPFKGDFFNNQQIDGEVVDSSARNEFDILDDWVQDGGIAVLNTRYFNDFSSDATSSVGIIFQNFVVGSNYPSLAGQLPDLSFPNLKRVSNLFPELTSIDTLHGYPANLMIENGRELIEANDGEVLYSYNTTDGTEVVGVFYLPRGAGGYIFYSFSYYNGIVDIEGWRDFLWKVSQIQTLPVAADSTSTGLCPVGTVKAFNKFPDLASNIFQDIEPTRTVCNSADVFVSPPPP